MQVTRSYFSIFRKCCCTFSSLLWIWLEKEFSKIFLWALRIFSKAKSQQWPEHPPFPIPFSTACFPLAGGATPAIPPSASCKEPGAGQSVSSPEPQFLPCCLRSRLPNKSGTGGELCIPPTYNTPPLFLTVSWWGGSSSKLLIVSTPGSFFLVIPAGRVWCINELQWLKLERPVVFNHLVHPPTWAEVFLTLFFLMLYVV